MSDQTTNERSNRPVPRRLSWRHLALALALGGAAIGLAACGSNGPSHSTTTTTPGY